MSDVGLEQRWARIISGEARGPAAALARLTLSIAALGYSAAVRIRNRLFDWGLRRVHRLPGPTIAVGNLTVGGTGKTPMVELVCRRLRAMGRTPAVLTRGYAAGPQGSDEARLLADRTPGLAVVTGRDRVASAASAAAAGADAFVLDDGFQHRRAGRDLDIVLIDVTDPDGLARVLPRGRLREPLSGLARAGLIALRLPAGADSVPPEMRARVDAVLARARAGVPVIAVRLDAVDLRMIGADFRSGSGRASTEATTSARGSAAISGGTGGPCPPSEGIAPLGELRGRRVAGFCGLGRPGAFGDTLRSLGAEATLTAMPDHHAYTAADLAGLRAANPDAELFATTEKDAVRLGWLPGAALGPVLPLAVVRAELRVLAGEADLDAALAAAMGMRGIPARA